MSEESNTREFRVDPADIIRATIRDHERQHGYFNVIDDLIKKLDEEIRVWYEFERRYEPTSSFLDAFRDDDDTLEELELPLDIGSISPLAYRTLVEPGVAPTKPPIAVDIPQWIPADDEPDEGI